MLEWYAGLSTLEKTYLIVGGLGALVFVIQFILLMLGGDSDSHGLGTTDTDGISDAHTSTDIDFQLLSVQSVSVMFMMFGVVGLSLSRAGFGAPVSVTGGVLVGGAAMFLVAKAFAFFRSLQSSGTMDLNNGVGQEARVYLTIKPGGVGQIEVQIQGQLRICDAITEIDTALPTDARVKVVKVVNNRFVVQSMK